MAALARFLMRVSVRFAADGCFTLASSLAYVTLLAIVPLVAIVLVVLAQFPVFSAILGEAERAMFTYFAPSFGAEAQAYLDRFVANTGQLTALGLIGLAATTIIFFTTIEDAFDIIWRAEKRRRVGYRLLAHVAALTSGAMLMGVALSVSSSDIVAGAFGAVGLDIRSARVLPLPMTTVGLALLYGLLPSRPARPGATLIAAIVAALLLEGLKSAFGAYVRIYPVYQTIYGALSAIPLFLVWLYCAWAVVLWGGEMAATLAERTRTREHA